MIQRINIEKETLKAIKDALPHGALQQIAETTNYSRVYVTNILEGNANLNERNKVIVEEAQEILKKMKEAGSKITTDIENTLKNK